MELPENWSIFKAVVIEKIKVYCDSNIWPFQHEDFISWLANFNDEREEYLALQILDNLIIKSKEMTVAGYSRLLHSEIRQFLVENNLIECNTIDSWKTKLKNGGLNKFIRFSPVKTDSDQGESGSFIYRTLSSELDTNRYSLSGKNSEHAQTIILVDDFLGSGDQFIDDFAPQFKMNEKLKRYIIIYSPLIAHKSGIERVLSKYPQINIIPSEVVSQDDSLFSNKNSNFFKNDSINSVDEAKTFYMGMREKYSPNNLYWLGYKDACLPLVFEWGCPNQAPSILWMFSSRNQSKWKQLFSRRA